jgi:hypothetical protein
VTVVEEARAAVAAGCCVLPVADDGSKKPAGIVGNWRAYQQDLPPVSLLRHWFVDHEAAGLGVIAGPVSKNLIAFDFDGAEIFDTLAERAEEWGLSTLLERARTGYLDATPGGGRRLLARYPDGWTWRDQPLARRPDPSDAKKVIPLIELCTWNVVAPSGARTHPSGRAYERLAGGFSTVAILTLEELEDVLALCRSFDEMPKETRAEPGKKPHRGLRPGDDFARQVTWRELLEGQGWKLYRVFPDRTQWTRPGKRTGCSGTTFGEDGPFWCFTSSTPFSPDESYSKFGAFAQLCHGGDYRRAAETLVDEGYGVPGEDYERNEKRSERNRGTSDPRADTRDERNEVNERRVPHVSFLSFNSSRMKPKLGSDALIGVAGRLVRLIDGHTEADQAAVLVSGLVMFGNVVGHTPGANVLSTRHSLNENALIAGRTGAGGRKGTATSEVRSVFRDVDEAWAKDQIISGLSTGEGLIEAVAKGNDKRVMLFEPEFSRTLRAMAREGNTLSPVIRQALGHGGSGNPHAS